MRYSRLLMLLLIFSCAVALCRQDSLTWPVAPGVTVTQMRHEAGPWEVRVLRIARKGQFARLDAALGLGTIRGVEKLSGIVKRESTEADTVVAGVNADFFTMAGNPRAGNLSGMTARRGELVTTGRGRPAFVVMADGTPLIGVFDTKGAVKLSAAELPLGGFNQEPPAGAASVFTHIYGWPVSEGCVVLKVAGLPLTPNGSWRGKVTEIIPPGTPREARDDEVLLRAGGDAAAPPNKLAAGEDVQLTLSTPGLAGSVAAAVGGNVELIRGGKILPDEKATDPRHPRTAVGFNDREIILATVDGRQAGWSVGMRYYELAKLMKELGCEEALNLDGGGSTTAWARGSVLNRPSDGGERLIADALLVRSTAPHGSASRIVLPLAELTALPGARVPLTVLVTDE